MLQGAAYEGKGSGDAPSPVEKNSSWVSETLRPRYWRDDSSSVELDTAKMSSLDTCAACRARKVAMKAPGSFTFHCSRVLDF